MNDVPWSSPVSGTGNAGGGRSVAKTMEVLAFPSRLRAPRSADDHSATVAAAKVLAVAGVAAYNWWVVVPFVPGLMPSVNGFFSDLEATGRPHAALMSDADLAAGILMAAALLLRGPRAGPGVRREWKWMVAFALAGVVGGRYRYACAEGLSATCRRLEWHLQLPVHHYIHVASGIVEFAALTGAAVFAMRRTRGELTTEARVYDGVVKVLVIGYPLLGLVYLTDRLGTLVEPVFFVAFSVMMLAVIFEPVGREATPNWAERVAARGIESQASGQAEPAAEMPVSPMVAVPPPSFRP
jgi:hypothetical protein